MRWVALVAGLGLVVVAFAAAARVADTQEGLVAEVVTLLGGGAGFLLLIYGLAARKRPAGEHQPAVSTAAPARIERAPSRRDLVLGGAGIAVALVLLSGLAYTGGPLWAGFGLAMLLPMLAGSVYLCVRYLRANP